MTLKRATTTLALSLLFCIGASATPSQETGSIIRTVTTIAAGGMHSLLLKTDGSVWVAGSNGSGQIGLGQGKQSVSTFQSLTLSGK